MYKTSPQWHDFLMNRLAAFRAIGGAYMRFRKAGQRTAELHFDWVLQSISALSVQRSGVQDR